MLEIKTDEIELISLPQLCRMLGKHRSTIYRWINAGLIPQPLRANGRVQGWTRQTIKDALSEMQGA